MTGFSALSTAISGLSAAQRGMDITGQNITNSNTPGYSRQLVKLDSVAPSLVASFYTGGNLTAVSGVQVSQVVRVRDQFIEQTRVSAGGAKAALDAQSSALSGVETLVNEPSTSSLAQGLSDFYASWSSLATNVNGQASAASAAGQVVLGKGANVASQMNLIANGLNQQWSTQLGNLKSTVDQLNDASTQLASMNAQIVASSAGTGAPVNELLDKRDVLLRTMGELAGATATIQANGSATVSVGGATVVNGTQTLMLSVAGGSSLGDVATDTPRIMAGTVVTGVSSGKAAGLLASVTTDIPNIATQLDDTATSLISAVNQLHGQGYTLAGDPGGDFFSGTNAGDIKVAVTSVSQLAVVDVAGTVSGANAQAIAGLATDSTATALLDGPGPSERWRSLASGLGARVQGLTATTAVQKTILDSAESASESDSGVNLDEEMTNLLQYQRSYQASAKVISAVDDMMQTLMNISTS